MVDGTANLNADWSTGTKSPIDETYLKTENQTAHAIKMEGVFVAPESGTYRFYVGATGSATLTLTDPTDNSQLVSVLVVNRSAPFEWIGMLHERSKR